MLTLTAEKREVFGKRMKALRAAARMPAVVYGPKQEATPITLSLKEFEKVLKEAGESSVVALAGISNQPLSVLIHDVDHDPITSIPRHVDFYAIEKGAKVEVAVPLVFAGESPAVKAGANLVKVLHEIEIEAAAADLPHEISVDISVLANINDQIHVRDIALPKGVVLKSDPEEVIVLVQEVQEEIEVVTETPDMEAIEVEKKGKQEEDQSAAPSSEK
ncbi:MAG: hypothetical protein B7X04_03440 [Parcubacteria group bacterium 21-54-25]|nr:MAG: hypothetical protein B7X04_03440 [Parcubacteria group bacterium 21-54-25]HQU08019.1 50S ribosomal protein L25 [Candidatus Paceibacterota bacterium]